MTEEGPQTSVKINSRGQVALEWEEEKDNCLLLEAIQVGQKILFEFGKTGRPNLETILETMRKEGWPKRECHCGRETRSPTKAEG